MDSKKTELYTLLLMIALFWSVTFLMLHKFISYLLLGALLGFVFYPLHKILIRKMRSSHAAGVSVLAAVLFIVIPFALIFYYTSVQAVDFFSTNSFSEISQNLGSATAKLGYGEQLGVILEKVRSNAFSFVADSAAGILEKIALIFVGLFISLFVMYYTLKDGIDLKRAVTDYLPIKKSVKEEIVQEISTTTKDVVKGQLLVALLQGVIGGIGFLIFGIEGAVVGGFLTFIAALVPGIGTPLVWIPVGLYQLYIGNTFAAFGFMAYSAIIVGAADNLLRPFIVGAKAKIHPLAVLLGVFGGIAVFGFVGLFIGPLIISIAVSLLRIYQRHSQHLL